MASISSSSSSSSSSFTFTASSPFLSRPKLGTHPFPPALLSIPRLTPRKTPNLSLSLTTAAATSKSGGKNAVPSKNPKMTKKEVVEEEEVEVEEELPWIQEKALDLVEFTGSVTQAIPGPRVGTSSLPWILVVPLAYAGITFVIAFVKTVKKFTSPRHQRKKLEVCKPNLFGSFFSDKELFLKSNAMLCKSIDELFQQGSDAVDNSTLKGLVQKTGFSVEEILRKYIRYLLNEKPWSADLISSLIQLRKALMLDDSQIAEILNEISRRIVREKGNF
ncbi:Ribosomal RNA small subunit methyltransferase J [Gossypium australe]|uniref:Ribosomal RNA small subunit methyltransferase J n=1 Tax=Gossypium australe TaxID=47621 RepID=A0A5B6WSV0_9ROSI|nr:Ribosomal RNA small subunit methyltransferase J [Gossypium australe]